jgi:xylulokinase
VSEPYLLGIDIGTSSTKGVLVELDGRVVSHARIEHDVSLPRPGWAEMDAEVIWWDESVRVIRSLLSQSGIEPGAVAALGMSSIGASFVPIDSTGVALRPGILYGIDTRALAEIAEIEARFGAERILACTGRGLSTQSVGAKLLWFRKNEPERWKRAVRFDSPVSFVTARLTGRHCIDYHTALSFHPLFDAGANDWDPIACRDLLGTRDSLPEVAWPQEVVGKITDEAAKATGLRAGMPVVCGTSDVIAEAVGAGVTEPGETLVMFGSTLFLVRIEDRFGAPPPLWPSYYVRPGLATVLAGTSTAGAIIQWFRRELMGDGDDEQFARLLVRAQSLAPGAEGLLALPYFAGERSPIFDPRASGLLIGLSLRHSSANVLRALLESIAMSFRHNVESMAHSGHSTGRHVASGGAANLPLLMRLCADVSGVPLSINGRRDAAPLGAAYLAGLGASAFNDFSVLRDQWTLEDEAVIPNPSVRADYDQLFRIYLDAYSQNAAAMHELNRLAG